MTMGCVSFCGRVEKDLDMTDRGSEWLSSM